MKNIARDAPLSLAHLSEIGTPPASLIDAAAAAGFSCVGLRTWPASEGGIAYPLSSPGERELVRERVAATGVGVQYIEQVTLTEATDTRQLSAMLEAGAAIGASRLCVAGDGTNFAAIARRMGEVCDMAADQAMSVDIEFTPFRGVASFKDAIEIVERADRPNVFVLIDALHFYRSGSSIEDLRRTDAKLLGTFQICDAPWEMPNDLVGEARLHRLLPGAGELQLWPLIDALPDGLAIGVEVPLYTAQPDMTVAERLTTLVRKTREFFASRKTT